MKEREREKNIDRNFLHIDRILESRHSFVPSLIGERGSSIWPRFDSKLEEDARICAKRGNASVGWVRVDSVSRLEQPRFPNHGRERRRDHRDFFFRSFPFRSIPVKTFRQIASPTSFPRSSRDIERPNPSDRKPNLAFPSRPVPFRFISFRFTFSSLLALEYVSFASWTRAKHGR